MNLRILLCFALAVSVMPGNAQQAQNYALNEESFVVLTQGASKQRKEIWTTEIPNRQKLGQAWLMYFLQMQSTRRRKDIPAELRSCGGGWMSAFVTSYRKGDTWARHNLASAMQQRQEIVMFAGEAAVQKAEENSTSATRLPNKPKFGKPLPTGPGPVEPATTKPDVS